MLRAAKRRARIWPLVGLLAGVLFVLPATVCYLVRCRCRSRVVDTITLPSSRAGALAVNASTGRLYASAEDGMEVVVFDVDDLAAGPIARVPTEGYHHGLAVDERRNRVYVVQGFSHAVRVIDGATHAFHDIAVPGLVNAISGLAVDPERRRLYVMRADNFDIAVFDTDTEAFLGPIGADCCPSRSGQIDVDPSTGLVYVLDAANGVVVLDPSGRRVAQVAVRENPRGIAVDAENRLAYVTNHDARSVSVIDLTSSGSTMHAVVDEIELAEHPQLVRVDPRSRRAFITNALHNTLSIVDLDGKRRIPDLPIGLFPIWMTHDPASNRVYASAADQRIAIVQACPARRARPWWRGLLRRGAPAPAPAPTPMGYDDPAFAARHRAQVLCERMYRTRLWCTEATHFQEARLASTFVARAGARVAGDGSAARLCGDRSPEPLEPDTWAAGFYYSVPVEVDGSDVPEVWSFHSRTKTVADGAAVLPTGAAVTRVEEPPPNPWGETFWRSSRCGTGYSAEDCCDYRPDLFSNPDRYE